MCSRAESKWLSLTSHSTHVWHGFLRMAVDEWFPLRYFILRPAARSGLFHYFLGLFQSAPRLSSVVGSEWSWCAEIRIDGRVGRMGASSASKHQQRVKLDRTKQSCRSEFPRLDHFSWRTHTNENQMATISLPFIEHQTGKVGRSRVARLMNFSISCFRILTNQKPGMKFEWSCKRGKKKKRNKKKPVELNEIEIIRCTKSGQHRENLSFFLSLFLSLSLFSCCSILLVLLVLPLFSLWRGWGEGGRGRRRFFLLFCVVGAIQSVSNWRVLNRFNAIELSNLIPRSTFLFVPAALLSRPSGQPACIMFNLRRRRRHWCRRW